MAGELTSSPSNCRGATGSLDLDVTMCQRTGNSSRRRARKRSSSQGRLSLRRLSSQGQRNESPMERTRSDHVSNSSSHRSKRSLGRGHSDHVSSAVSRHPEAVERSGDQPRQSKSSSNHSRCKIKTLENSDHVSTSSSRRVNRTLGRGYSDHVSSAVSRRPKTVERSSDRSSSTSRRMFRSHYDQSRGKMKTLESRSDHFPVVSSTRPYKPQSEIKYQEQAKAEQPLSLSSSISTRNKRSCSAPPRKTTLAHSDALTATMPKGQKGKGHQRTHLPPKRKMSTKNATKALTEPKTKRNGTSPTHDTMGSAHTASTLRDEYVSSSDEESDLPPIDRTKSGKLLLLQFNASEHNHVCRVRQECVSRMNETDQESQQEQRKPKDQQKGELLGVNSTSMQRSLETSTGTKTDELDKIMHQTTANDAHCRRALSIPLRQPSMLNLAPELSPSRIPQKPRVSSLDAPTSPTFSIQKPALRNLDPPVLPKDNETLAETDQEAQQEQRKPKDQRQEQRKPKDQRQGDPLDVNSTSLQRSLETSTGARKTDELDKIMHQTTANDAHCRRALSIPLRQPSMLNLAPELSPSRIAQKPRVSSLDAPTSPTCSTQKQAVRNLDPPVLPKDNEDIALDKNIKSVHTTATARSHSSCGGRSHSLPRFFRRSSRGRTQRSGAPKEKPVEQKPVEQNTSRTKSAVFVNLATPGRPKPLKPQVSREDTIARKKKRKGKIVKATQQPTGGSILSRPRPLSAVLGQ